MQLGRLTAISAVAAGLILVQVAHSNRTIKPSPGLGNPDAVRLGYERWKSSASPGRLKLSLAWSKGLSAVFTDARGSIELDGAAGTMSVDVHGLERDELLEVWLVENRPGHGRTVVVEEGDRTVRIGRLQPRQGRAVSEGRLPAEVLGNFDLDLVVIAKAAEGPRAGGLLYGTPDLFQRLYSREQQAVRGAAPRRISGYMLAVAAPLTLASGSGDPEPQFLDSLVEQGEDLFFNGTFSGNGRTCGSCHPAENNLTIDPAFIATRPASDPLFIAENRPSHPFPDLVFELNGGKRFENPDLMRQHGLIAENQDGFGDLAQRFNMRSVPHVFAQGISIAAPPGGLVPPAERTGWSGDGAPNNGALRDFATGAVTQHFTRSLNRVPNVDFILPTPDELTAMEAFQLSLGRQDELNLATLTLKDGDAAAGQALFQDNTVARCNICHFQAGANGNPGIFGANPGNRNFNTGVEFFAVGHPDGTGEVRPVDGGFGTNPAGNFASVAPNAGNPNRPDGGFGNGTFNTPSLVELADTLPAFHNNITAIDAGLGSTPDLPDTVEGAIEFYTRPEFSQAGNAPIVLNPTQISQLGKFLRSINALDNRRSASDLGARARAALSDPPFDNAAVNRLITVAIADCDDAIEVLDAVGLFHHAQQRFKQAQQKFQGAMSGPTHKRIEKLDQAEGKLADARAEIETVP